MKGAARPSCAPVSDVEVDGVSVSADHAWHDGLVTVDSRAFQLRAPADTAPPWSHSPPDRDGTIAFSRPPRRGSTRHRRPVVDAIRDARSRATTLWECRPDQPGFLTTPIGIRVADGSNLNLDLGTDAALAISGSDHFRQALARSIIVEAVTAHGPADVDLVIMADTGRLAAWDWAKWLPHTRPDGPPRIWSSLHDITRWAEDASARQATGRATRLPSSTALICGTGGMLRCERSFRRHLPGCG